MLATPVKVGTDNVVIGPVFVYVGNRLADRPALEMLVGGQGYRAEVEAAIEEGTPPVCHGRKAPLKGSAGVTLRDAHLP